MAVVETEIRDRIGYIWLNRPASNDMTIEMFDELIEAHQAFDRDENVWGLILGSKIEKYFSNGLEPDYMLSRDIKERGEVFARLFDLVKVIYGSSKVEIAAINGHAMAGGAILAILTDYRFMARGKGRYSFSEVRVGLTIPPVLLEIIEAVVGRKNLVQTAMVPKAFKPEEALAINLVDKICEPERLVTDAEKHLRSIFELPLKSVQSVKKAIRASLLEKLYRHSEDDLKDMQNFLDGNFVEGLTSVKERRRPRFSNP